MCQRLLDNENKSEFSEEAKALLAVFPRNNGVDGSYLRLHIGGRDWKQGIMVTLMYGLEPLSLLHQLEAVVDVVLLKHNLAAHPKVRPLQQKEN